MKTERLLRWKEMPQFLSSVKLYLLVVLLPQLIYLLTNSHGLAAVCESCSPSNYIDLYLRLLQNPSSFSRHVAPPGTCSSQAEAIICANSDEASTVEDNDETVSLEAHTFDEYWDKSAAEMCSCLNREFNNLSIEAVSIQTSSGHAMEGGWHIPHPLPDLVGHCSIKRRNASLTQLQFLKKFAFTEPVILTGVSDQSIFRAHSTKQRLLHDFGAEMITVATANTHSYRKVKMTLCEYVERYMKPQTLDSLGNETFYHFGDNDRERWDSLFSLYQVPPYQLPDQEPVLSFGLAGPGTGVPFHIHGPTFAETIYGRKHWFLYPPDAQPQFHPDVNTLHWLTHTYPTLTEEDKPMECTLNPGEVIYFPDRWWHATLNLDSAIFMSTFYS